MNSKKIIIVCASIILCVAILSVGVYAAIVGNASLTSNGTISFTVKEVFADVKLEIDGASAIDSAGSALGTAGTANLSTFEFASNKGTFAGKTYDSATDTPLATSWTWKHAVTGQSGSDNVVTYTFTFKNDGANDMKVQFSAFPTTVTGGTITSQYVLNGGAAVTTGVNTALTGGLLVSTTKSLVVTVTVTLNRRTGATAGTSAISFGAITISNPANV